MGECLLLITEMAAARAITVFVIRLQESFLPACRSPVLRHSQVKTSIIPTEVAAYAPRAVAIGVGISGQCGDLHSCVAVGGSCGR
jgi:hypothetical protein